jgi:hypothetical protein
MCSYVFASMASIVDFVCVFMCFGCAIMCVYVRMCAGRRRVHPVHILMRISSSVYVLIFLDVFSYNNVLCMCNNVLCMCVYVRMCAGRRGVHRGAHPQGADGAV